MIKLISSDLYRMQVLQQQGMDISKHQRVILSLSYPDHGYRLLAFNLRLRLYLCSISRYGASLTVVSSLKLSKRSTAFRNSYPAAIASLLHGKQTDVAQDSGWPLSIMIFTYSVLEKKS